MFLNIAQVFYPLTSLSALHLYNPWSLTNSITGRNPRDRRRKGETDSHRDRDILLCRWQNKGYCIREGWAEQASLSSGWEELWSCRRGRHLSWATGRDKKRAHFGKSLIWDFKYSFLEDDKLEWMFHKFLFYWLLCVCLSIQHKTQRVFWRWYV